MFVVCLFEVKNSVLKFDHHKTNMFKSVGCLKNDVQVCSICNLAILLKAVLLCLISVHKKPTIGCSSSITKRLICSSLSDV